MASRSEEPPQSEAAAEVAAGQGDRRDRLRELAIVFLRLGVLAFGGPAAHIAMMEDEVVQRRQWFSREKLLDLMGVTSLIPGPNSTELAIHIGYERGGWPGLWVAGLCFIFPAMTLVWVLAVLYQQYQTLPQADWLLYGIKPVIIAIVARALWKLGRVAVQDWLTGLVFVVGVGAILAGLNEILWLLLAGVGVMVGRHWRRDRPPTSPLLWFPVGEVLAQTSAVRSPVLTPARWLGIFLVFLKIGAVLYGSGYVLLAFLQAELVEQRGWLTSQQLLDAVAVGQFTPGPLFTTATFVGYLMGGNLGAIAATVGIFLPAFLLVALVNPWVPKLRQSPWASGFLSGVNAASLALMAVVTWILAQAALVDWLTIVVALGALGVVLRTRLNSAWLVVAGGAIGLLVKGLGWL